MNSTKILKQKYMENIAYTSSYIYVFLHVPLCDASSDLCEINP